MRTFRLLLPALTIVASACASVAPADRLRRLERERDLNPASLETTRALGMLYYRLSRFDDARRTLKYASELDPEDAATALYLGMAAERQGDFATARAAYSTYLSVGRASRVRGQLEARLAAITRREIEATARQAIARERELATVPGSPRTVAVMPLAFTGSDTTLRPLERGLTELLVTDLARSSQLVVVERARLQALLDEISLQRSGVTEAATNVRAGRLLQAGRLVQGSIAQQGTRLRVDAAVVSVPTTSVEGTANADGALDQLFSMEKSLVFSLLRTLGVTVSPAEREAIEQRPTRSLQAFLAYSRGLGAEDAGRFDDARLHYEQATRLDPAFVRAGERLRAAQAMRSASGVSVTAFEASLAGTTEAALADAALQGETTLQDSDLGTTVRETSDDLNPSAIGAATGGSGTTQRDGAADATGTDRLTRGARIVITVKRPGAI